MRSFPIFPVYFWFQVLLPLSVLFLLIVCLAASCSDTGGFSANVFATFFAGLSCLRLTSFYKNFPLTFFFPASLSITSSNLSFILFIILLFVVLLVCVVFIGLFLSLVGFTGAARFWVVGGWCVLGSFGGVWVWCAVVWCGGKWWWVWVGSCCSGCGVRVALRSGIFGMRGILFSLPLQFFFLYMISLVY